MSGGMPMPDSIAREIIEMVERAAGPERVRAIREAHANFHPIFEAMTTEERVRWILGEDEVEP